MTALSQENQSWALGLACRYRLHHHCIIMQPMRGCKTVAFQAHAVYVRNIFSAKRGQENNERALAEPWIVFDALEGLKIILYLLPETEVVNKCVLTVPDNGAQRRWTGVIMAALL